MLCDCVLRLIKCENKNNLKNLNTTNVFSALVIGKFIRNNFSDENYD